MENAQRGLRPAVLGVAGLACLALVVYVGTSPIINGAASDVMRASADDFIVPEEEAEGSSIADNKLTGDMEEFEKTLGKMKEKKGVTPIAVNDRAKSSTMVEVDSRNAPQPSHRPDASAPLPRPTLVGSAAKNAAKDAVATDAEFEKSMLKADPSNAARDRVQHAVPVTVGPATGTILQVGKVQQGAKTQQQLTKKPEAKDDADAPSAAGHSEQSAARNSANAVDDLSNFEKAVSSTKAKKAKEPPIKVPQQKAEEAKKEDTQNAKMSEEEWGEKELLLAKGLVTWLEHDNRGGKCDAEYERQMCGHLSCSVHTNNTCQYCMSDADCHSPRYRCFGPGKTECKPGHHCQCHHKMLFPLVGADVEAMILAFLATALAASGGIGGGGLLVPLFVLVEDFEADLASPLSSATITGGAIVGYALYCQRWHPLFPAVQRPLIDYETVLIILPSLLTGTMIGTIFDKTLPLWFIMTMLFLLLGFSTFRTCQKGIQTLESESTDPAVPKYKFDPSLEDPLDTEGGDDLSKLESEAADIASDEPLKKAMDEEEVDDMEEDEGTITGTRFPKQTLITIAVFWVVVLLIAFLKGGGYAQPSILPFVQCNNHAYWILQLGCWGAMFVVFIFVRDQVLSQMGTSEGGLDGDIVWTPMNSITLPMLCLPCGIAAGLLGVGGGMVVGPLLLELGARHSTVSATSTFTILVTASSSAAQFVLMGKLPPYYALFFAVIGGAGTLVGQLAVERIIKRYNSTSIIVFGISAVICASTIAMGYTGMRSIARIATVGGNMGLRNLCD